MLITLSPPISAIDGVHKMVILHDKANTETSLISLTF